MIKRFLPYLGSELELEKRFFRYSSFYTAVLAFLSFIQNVTTNLSIYLQLFSLVYVVFCISCYFLSKIDKIFDIVKNIFFVGLIILLDISYFLSGGLDSSITYIFIITFLMLNLSIKNRKVSQFIVFVVFIINLFILFFLEQKYPSLLIPYPNIEAKHTDLISGFFLVSLIIALTNNFFKTTYEKLLFSIDSKNKELIISEKKAYIEKEKAEDANNAKKEFLSVMSHEIRTPLNAIISIIQLLEKNEVYKEDTLIKTLKDSSENLLALVSNILDFSKIESGEVQLEEINFNLKDIIESIVNVHKAQAIEKKNTLNVNFEGFESYFFLGDPLRLGQIFINLISNAIKFTENGFIDFNIKLIEKNDNKSKIYFEIKDNGIGISQDKIESVFEKFTQENLTITRRYGGSGLGLSIIKKLIERMGSRIEVESKIGVGSKFFFYLELENSNKVLDVSYQPEKINSFNPHILIVEDNKVNVMVATKFLDKWNMTYEVAENGLIATQKFQKNKFDLILMDLQMPEMDGYTATQEIRKLDKTIPIIALTANTVSEEREKCLNSGFNEYITKPFKSENLHDKIRFFTNDKNIS